MICKNCNNKISDDMKECPFCHTSVMTSQNDNVPAKQTPPEIYFTPPVMDKGSIGLGILSGIIPPIGLILFLVNKKEMPKKARHCGLGALIGLCVELVISLIIGIFLIISVNSSSISYNQGKSQSINYEPTTSYNAESSGIPTTTPIEKDAAPTKYIEAEKTTQTHGAKFGEWVKTTSDNSFDGLYHYIFIKLDKITTQTEDASYVKDAVDKNNSLSAIRYGLDDVPKDIEFCVLDYEIYIPEEFSQGNWGVPRPGIAFEVNSKNNEALSSPDGKTYYSNFGHYSELYLFDKNKQYYSGKIYKLRGLYTMVKGHKDYIFKYSYADEGADNNAAKKTVFLEPY